MATILLSGILIAQTYFINYGSTWKYLDNGSNQGTTWRNTSFNDASWASGPAQLGYGDGDEATVVSYGSNANKKFITTYFRKTITITDASIFSSFTLNVKRDDGAVVSINGTERFRTNMPNGTISYTTKASTDAADDGNTPQTIILAAGTLVTGTNVIAVEIHQRAGNSTDISFDLQLSGASDVTPPIISSFSPADNATNVSNTSNLVLTFNENIQKGTGNILVKEGGVITQTIDVTTAAVTVSGNTATINPADFTFGAAVNIEIAADAFKDLANNNYAGIADASTWNFSVQMNATALLTRGPYMNSALQSGITIRWRTDVATNSKVSYGTSAGSLTQSVTDNTSTTEHIITLTGLTTNTLFYYSIGSTTQTLQGDVNNYFKTMPTVGSTQKIRVLAMGDMGNNSTNQVNVRNAYQSFNGTNYTDAWILLGDNAYNSGTDLEYQTNFFNIYQGSLTKNHVLWPAPGNHDYANSTARQADHLIPYYDMFTLPSAGQAGGVASGTEAFYSYNYGNIHFVALDSYGWETGNTRLYDTLGPQVTWLKQDLAANTQPWTIAYFHHPPYTKGSHNSDTETELINMRERVVRILERYKVDLVLNGHSHSYERSYLINGHYGLENTFNPSTHALSTSSAKYNGTVNSCTYIKNGADVLNGIVYAVVGSAGQLGGTTTGYPHDAMYYSDVTNGGTLFFEVEDNRLDAKWICADGVIRDNFTIMKDVNKTTNLSIPTGTPSQLSASWIGNYSWSTGETTRTITVSPTINTTYTVTDGLSCIADVFNITVTGANLNRITKVSPEISLPESFKIMPTLVNRGQQVLIRSGNTKSEEITLIDINGRVIQHYRINQSLSIQTDKLQSGIYFIRKRNKENSVVLKFVVID